MSAGAWLRSHAALAVWLGCGATVALLAWGFAGSARVALAGWLVGLLFWIGVALGAMALLAVHALTGGRWLAAATPILAPASASLAVLCVAAAPPLLAPGLVWPWVDAPGLAADPAVARWYLRADMFVLRSAVALLGWAVFGMWLALGGAGRGGVGAAALVFHALALTWFGQDWVMSFDPSYRATAFPMALGVAQVLAALAWCGLLRSGRRGGPQEDLGSALFAAALGAIYLGYVQYLVAWYGNLPDKAEWFLRRQAMPWSLVAGASLLASTLVPLAVPLMPSARRHGVAMGWVCAAVLAGVLLHIIWLIGPGVAGVGPAEAILAGLLGALAVGGLWVGLVAGPFAMPFAHGGRKAAHGG